MRARDIMTRDVEWIGGDTTAYEATECMRGRQISSLLVERRDPDDAWGIVTRTDVVQEVVEPGRDLRQVPVHRPPRPRGGAPSPTAKVIAAANAPTCDNAQPSSARPVSAQSRA